jgi:hypothetical protein
MSTLFGGDIHAGLSGLELADGPFDLGEGIWLRQTYAHLFAPFMLAFKPAPPGNHHPGPWKAASGGFSYNVNAELLIPADIEGRFESKIGVARTLVFLLRLGVNPAITLPVFSNYPFSTLPKVPERWQVTHHLLAQSAEFTLAVEALDAGQFVHDQALTLVSLWGALEALFSPSTSELRFRVSSLISAFLESPGVNRANRQKEISKLYDKRSAAAHGKPKHEPEHLLQTFNLVREVLIRIIDRGQVPTKDELEGMLFGAI